MENFVEKEVMNEEMEVKDNDNITESAVYLIGIIDEYNDFLIQLKANDNADIIKIYINSFGGEWDKVLDYVNYINELKNRGKKIISIITGYCCSASVMIPLVSDYVIIRELSQIMIHKPFMYIAFAEKLDDTKIISINNELKNIWDGILNLIKSKCGEENMNIILERVKNEQDVWINCEEALKLKLVDEIEKLNIANYNNFIEPKPLLNISKNNTEVKNENIVTNDEIRDNDEEIIIKPISSDVRLFEEKSIKQFYKKITTVL